MRLSFTWKYLLLVVVPALFLILLIGLGEQRFGPPHAGTFQRSPGETQPAFEVLTLILQIAVILVVARLTGALFRKFGQPQAVGEMAAGILLGPSVFGALAPTVSAYVFPTQSLSYLNALSQIGLLLFMFLIGLEMDARILRGTSRTALITSHASIVVPFTLGVLLSLGFFEYAPPSGGVGFTGYALFMGTALSITAFPVLARILQERGLTGTKVGALSLACAAINDATAWVILAFVVIVVRAGEVGGSFVIMLGGTLAFGAFMLLVARPLARGYLDRRTQHVTVSQDMIAFVLIFALASAWVTEKLGIHALFGAFLAGAILPAHYPFVRDMIRRMEDLTVVFLLPIFFAFTGLRTEIALLDTPTRWLKALLILTVAVIGKFGGSALAARASGMKWREAGAIGALMNTRGLMELVVLNIGLDLGVIPPTLFVMMVLMALATTMMTAPLLRLMRVSDDRAMDREDAADHEQQRNQR